MTPINNFSVLEEVKSPVHQQFQNLFGQPILQNSSSVDNQQSNRNSVMNTPVATVNNNTNREQQQNSFSPSIPITNNTQQDRNPSISIAPMAKFQHSLQLQILNQQL